MLGSSVLETAIGMVFVFLVMSLLVTAGTELIAAWWKWRSDNLWEGVVNLVDQAGKNDWAKKLYDHPLIQGLSALQKKPVGTSIWKQFTGILKYLLTPKSKGPSYIPSRTFAIALLDVIREENPTLKLIERELQFALDGIPLTASVADAKSHIIEVISKIDMTGSTIDELKADLTGFVSRIPEGGDKLLEAKTKLKEVAEKIPTSDASLADFKAQFINLLDQETPTTYTGADLSRDAQVLIGKIPYAGTVSEAVKKDLNDLITRIPTSGYPVIAVKADIQNFVGGLASKYFREIVSQIDSSQLKRTLLTLMDEADQNIEKLKEDIETWFNNSMDRVTGWYKRKTQIAHLLLGLLFTVLLNVDSVLIVRSLTSDPDLRKAVVAQAEKFAAEPPVAIPTQATSAQSRTKSTAQQSNPQTGDVASPPSGQATGGAAAAPSISFTPDSVVGGNSLKAIFNLGATANKEVRVTIAGGDPDIITIDPASQTIAIGKQEADFVIKTKPLSTARSTSVIATYDGKTTATLLTVSETPEEKYRLLRAQLNQLNLPIGWVSQKSDGPLILAPDAIAGGSSVTGYISRDKTAEQDITVHLKSDDDKIAKVNAESIVIPKGQKEATFTVQTVSTDKPKTVTISASFGEPATTHATTLNIDPVYRSEYRYWPGWPWTRGSSNWLASMWDTVSFHLIGWLLTAMAASLGAPFWFDILNKFITIRSAGKSPEEKPKPPKEVPQPLEPGQTPREADLLNAASRR